MAAKKEYGLQNDGSLVVDEENDYCVQYLRNINWNSKPIERTTAAFPWITKDEFKNSMTHKYMHYQTEDGYCNPNDPLATGENVKNLRADENRERSRAASRKNKTGFDDFNQLHQEVREVKEAGANDDEEEDDDDFLDEYGNIKDPEQMSSQTTIKENVLQNKEEIKVKNKPNVNSENSFTRSPTKSSIGNR